MKKFFLFLLIFTILSFNLAAQNIVYSVEGIPELGNEDPEQSIIFDFSEESQINSWSIDWTNGDVTASMSYEPVEGNGSLSISMEMISSAKVDIAHFFNDVVSIQGGSISFDVFIPQVYIDNGYAIQIFVKDANWAGAYNWIDSSGLIGDAWNTIQLINIEESSFSYNPGILMDSIKSVGIEFDQNGGAASSFNVLLDNIEISSTTPEIPIEFNDVNFNFEDGTLQGFALGWGSAVQEGVEPVEYSTDLASQDNNGSMKINLDLTNPSWADANVQTYMGSPGAKFDLSYFESIEYDIYIPEPDSFTGTLMIQTALNDNWGEVSPWLNINVPEENRVIINGTEYALIHISNSLADLAAPADHSQLVIRFADSNSTYVGPAYVDNVLIKAQTTPVIIIDTPEELSYVSGIYSVEAKVIPPNDLVINDVVFSTEAGISISMTNESENNYILNWDTLLEQEGLVTFTITAITPDGNFSKDFEVIIKNSGTYVAVNAPIFADVLTGTVEISADVVNINSESIDSVTVTIHNVTIPMIYSSGDTYTAMFNTLLVEDGAYTVLVKAYNGDYISGAATDAVINNKTEDPIIKTENTMFVAGEEPFYYVGWNAYDLPFKNPNTLSVKQKALIYTTTGEKLVEILPAGTVQTYEQLIDRSMMEARKLGMTVLRTWGFNTDRNQEHPFYNEDWTFNEDQFKRFDYIMDSARRHGIKVIVALQNYWTAYGGIQAVADDLGIYMLEFFTNSDAKQMYKEYMDFFVNRINTINGISYKEDSTLFCWELMNEPRIGLDQDTSPGQTLWDPTGAVLGAWIDEMSTYIKSLDNKHMVSTGSEGHGFQLSTGEIYASDTEGYGNDPIGVMDQPNIDFFTFHPYLNEYWLKADIPYAKLLIQEIVRDALEHGKPIVMEEFGINKNETVVDLFENEIEPEEENYKKIRLGWYELMLETLRREGGAGSNVWMLQTNPQENNFGISTYTLYDLAEEDRDLVEVFINEAKTIKAIGGANFIYDINYPPYNKYKWYIHEVVYNDLFKISKRYKCFFPNKIINIYKFIQILKKLDIKIKRMPYILKKHKKHMKFDVKFKDAAKILYTSLKLYKLGNMYDILNQFDLLPKDLEGNYRPNKELTRGETAELLMRLQDFLLFYEY